MALETKLCAVCGAVISRMAGVSGAQWANRRYCDKRCAAIFNNEMRRLKEPFAASKVCPACGDTFRRKAHHSNAQWDRMTWCCQACSSSAAARAWRAVHGPIGYHSDAADPLCECGNPATIKVRITTLSAEGTPIHGRLPLCDDCKQLFDEEEAARHVWGAVRAEPRKRWKPHKEWKT